MQNISNNVIVFPKENKNIQKTISIDEINHNVEMMSHYHIQETITNIIPLIFNQLEISGFYISEMDEDEDIKDGAFLIESLRSIMCKHYGIYHPFQKVAQNVFQDDVSEEGVLKIVDELVLGLKEDEQCEEKGSDNS